MLIQKYNPNGLKFIFEIPSDCSDSNVDLNDTKTKNNYSEKIESKKDGTVS